jgi:hypothetical protein
MFHFTNAATINIGSVPKGDGDEDMKMVKKTKKCVKDKDSKPFPAVTFIGLLHLEHQNAREVCQETCRTDRLDVSFLNVNSPCPFHATGFYIWRFQDGATSVYIPTDVRYWPLRALILRPWKRMARWHSRTFCEMHSFVSPQTHSPWLVYKPKQQQVVSGIFYVFCLKY